MHKRTVILFDLDGVLVDTALLHFNAWKSVAAEYGLILDSTVERQLRGLSREQSFEVVFSGSSQAKANAKQICTLKNQRFLDELDCIPPEKLLVPNAVKLIEDLQTQQATLVIASGSRNARSILQKTGLTPHFDLIIDGSIETEKKPDPVYYRNILALLDISAENTLLFEDSEACIEAATQRGIRTVAVNCPPQLPATLHIKNLANLTSASTLDLLRSANGRT